jgi:hypothetical protein
MYYKERNLKAMDMRRKMPVANILACCMVAAVFIGCAGSAEPANPPVAGGDNPAPVNAGVNNDPVNPPAPEIQPPAVPPTQPLPSQPAPAQPSLSSQVDPAMIINKQAGGMILNQDDMGTGWYRGTAIAPAIQQVYSASHVYFTQGSSFAPGVQNTVAVFRSIDAARNAYAREKPSSVVTSNPGIGDESFFNDSVPINKLLVFRKNNIVAWVWLKQSKSGDIEHYARIVEQKINAAASAAAVPVVLAPPEKPADSGSSLPASTPAAAVVSRQAYQMVLTLEDMGPGWARSSVASPTDRQILSSCHMLFTQGSTFGPSVNNTVSIYRTPEAAAAAYAKEKPANTSVSNPSMGDESFLDDSVAISKKLVFRKGDTVAWVWLQQDKSGDIEKYARIVEKKITQ